MMVDGKKTKVITIYSEGEHECLHQYSFFRQENSGECNTKIQRKKLVYKSSRERYSDLSLQVQKYKHQNKGV